MAGIKIGSAAMIEIGYAGENKTRKIIFDAKEWMEKLPGCEPTIVGVRADGVEFTAPDVRKDEEEKTIIWTLTAGETIAGEGEAQILWMDGERVAKKAIMVTMCRASLETEATVPDAPEPTWGQVAIDAMQRAQAAASKAEAAQGAVNGAKEEAIEAIGEADAAAREGIADAKDRALDEIDVAAGKAAMAAEAASLSAAQAEEAADRAEAAVTTESIKSALGYTPANQEDVNSLFEENDELKETIDNETNSIRCDIASFATIEKSSNVYDVENSVSGKYVFSDGKIYDGNYNMSQPIDLTNAISINVRNFLQTELDNPKTAYGKIAFYDENGDFMASVYENGSTNPLTDYSIPSGAKSMVLCEQYTYMGRCLMVVLDGTPITEYKAYGEVENVILKSATGYENHRIVSFGDSLVENGGWQDVVSEIVGCPVLNMGIGGTCMTNRNNQYWVNEKGRYLAYATEPQPAGGILCWDSISGKPINTSGTDRIDLIPTDTDIVIVEFGTNDLHQDKALGTWSDTDNNTFRGAMKLCAERIRNRIPLAKVIFVTPTVERTDFTNGLGLHKVDYIKAILEAETEINVPVINLWSKTSWSVATYPNYSVDDLHWNELGKQKVGEIIGGYLMAEKPLIN